jgi:hypothetical protein
VDSRPAPEGTEYPLSEGGAWSHHGFHYAYLTGLALDHQGEAVVHVSPTLAGEPQDRFRREAGENADLAFSRYTATSTVSG